MNRLWKVLPPRTWLLLLVAIALVTLFMMSCMGE
jgi:hypothetical protein